MRLTLLRQLCIRSLIRRLLPQAESLSLMEQRRLVRAFNIALMCDFPIAVSMAVAGVLFLMSIVVSGPLGILRWMYSLGTGGIVITFAFAWLFAFFGFYVIRYIVIVSMWPKRASVILRRVARKHTDILVCENCGYDLQGTSSTICSECGSSLQRDGTLGRR